MVFKILLNLFEVVYLKLSLHYIALFSKVLSVFAYCLIKHCIFFMIFLYCVESEDFLSSDLNHEKWRQLYKLVNYIGVDHQDMMLLHRFACLDNAVILNTGFGDLHDLHAYCKLIYERSLDKKDGNISHKFLHAFSTYLNSQIWNHFSTFAYWQIWILDQHE